MSATENYTTSFVVDRSPKEVFDAVADVRAWWTGTIEGEAGRLGAEYAL